MVKRLQKAHEAVLKITERKHNLLWIWGLLCS